MSKYLNLIIILVVLSLFSISVIAPGTVITNVGTNGYQIETTPYFYMKLGQNFTANFHVFNLSDGKPLSNTSINCELHVYNQLGTHILKNTKLPFSNTDNEWEVYMSEGNFSQIGLYSWIVYCNSSVYGGFRSATFEITHNGFDNTPKTEAGLPVLIFMLFIIIGLFVLGFTGKFSKHEIVNLVLQRGCIVAGIMIAMYTTTLLLNIVTYANMDILGNEMIFLMTWIGWAGYIAAVYLVIQTLFDILSLRKQKREKKIREYENG